ncbi:hypothetical protein COO60DRAFT_1481902 [Scenedesmus sp. NREL 46B-D3]|nr:hypothetical protein COO60DRAFT_1481902 [Scenedesmus sp. NREL 46B-D3]
MPLQRGWQLGSLCVRVCVVMHVRLLPTDNTCVCTLCARPLRREGAGPGTVFGCSASLHLQGVVVHVLPACAGGRLSTIAALYSWRSAVHALFWPPLPALTWCCSLVATKLASSYACTLAATFEATALGHGAVCSLPSYFRQCMYACTAWHCRPRKGLNCTSMKVCLGSAVCM